MFYLDLTLLHRAEETGEESCKSSVLFSPEELLQTMEVAWISLLFNGFQSPRH